MFVDLFPNEDGFMSTDMRVGIDGGCWSNQRGYGRFLREVMKALGEVGSSHRYTVYLDSSSYPLFDLKRPFEARRVATSQGVAQSATADSHRSLRDLLRMSLAVREPLDLFFFPSVYSFFPLLRRIPVIVGIHDTIADRNPQFSFSSQKQRWLWRAKVRLALAQADTILTVSQYSKRSIAEWFDVPADRIAVVQEAASPQFYVRDFEPPPRPFALYAGGISPNKNLALLIRAFSRSDARAQGVQLVLAGDYTSDRFKGNYAELKALVAELDVGRQVVFTGFVPDEELCRLYNTCTVFVMPSLDEGFGLPAIEAMSCGRPVIVSSGNSLEELVGDAGLTVDPHKPEELTAAIDRIFSCEDLRRSLAKRAIQRASQFSWETAARQLLEVFEQTRARRAR
jgi:glycosyltransferase involved in cell wall biosynthesis